jgi:hypothetical protein
MLVSARFTAFLAVFGVCLSLLLCGTLCAASVGDIFDRIAAAPTGSQPPSNTQAAPPPEAKIAEQAKLDAEYDLLLKKHPELKVEANLKELLIVGRDLGVNLAVSGKYPLEEVYQANALRKSDPEAYPVVIVLMRDGMTFDRARKGAISETRKRLADEIDLDFQRTSVDNVLEYINALQKVNIVLSPDIGAAGIDLSSRLVDMKVKHMSIELILGRILSNDLGYVVCPGYILVTTKEKAKRLAAEVVVPAGKAASDLNMARAYRRNGMLDKAKGLLDAIIKTYPETLEATEAQKELKEIKAEAEKPVEKAGVPSKPGEK